MDLEPANQADGGLSERACRLLAGVDVGLAGSLAAIGWLLFHSALQREFWWAKLNVAGAFFYGPGVYSMGVGRATLAGFALLLVTYTALGALFGAAAQPRKPGRNLLLALILTVAWHFFAQVRFWPWMDTFAPSYFPRLATMPAHLLYVLCLSRFSGRFWSLASSFGDPSWAAAGVTEYLHEGDLGEGAGLTGEETPAAAPEVAAAEDETSPETTVLQRSEPPSEGLPPASDAASDGTPGAGGASQPPKVDGGIC